jgi:oligoribonuclease (3'-5' exoribonuclease)
MYWKYADVSSARGHKRTWASSNQQSDPTQAEQCYTATNSMREAITVLQADCNNPSLNIDHVIVKTLPNLLAFFHARVLEVVHSSMGIALSDVSHVSKKIDLCITAY